MLKAFYWVAPTQSKMIMEIWKMVKVTQVFSSIMLTALKKSLKLENFSLLGSEIPGVKVSGLESLLMKMKHGMTIRVLKKSWSTSLKMMETGG